jgi:hypothetical protein
VINPQFGAYLRLLRLFKLLEISAHPVNGKHSIYIRDKKALLNNSNTLCFKHENVKNHFRKSTPRFSHGYIWKKLCIEHGDVFFYIMPSNKGHQRAASHPVHGQLVIVFYELCPCALE